MQKEQTILFLYTRLPDYFYRCIQYFVSAYPCKIVVVRYREDINARYSFPASEHIHLHYKDEIDVAAFTRDLDPVAIVLSGWRDKVYTSTAQEYGKRIPVIMTMDNPWLGSMRQKVLCAIAPWFLHKAFNRVWITGRSQYEYARRLGFDKRYILDGMYSADVIKFYNRQEDVMARKTSSYPRTLVYVGRMVEYKQPHILAKLFNEIVSTHKLDWKLILAGEGPLKETIRQKNYTRVELADFITPADLPEFYKNAGIFCLPSKEEHWGVAVHEAAAAGLPLLLSDTVEAGSQFLIQDYNGFAFKTGDEESFKTHLFQLMEMPATNLLEMGKNSISLSKRVTHETWAATLNSFLH